MGSDQSFLLGEYGARLDSLEATVGRMDKNIEFLVQRETERATTERVKRVYAGAILSAVASIGAFVIGLVREWAFR
jgi:hypothetical protein